MAALGLLHRIHCEQTQGIDGQLVDGIIRETVSHKDLCHALSRKR
jgi:hypothetical protein